MGFGTWRFSRDLPHGRIFVRITAEDRSKFCCVLPQLHDDLLNIDLFQTIARTGNCKSSRETAFIEYRHRDGCSLGVALTEGRRVEIFPDTLEFGTAGIR